MLPCLPFVSWIGVFVFLLVFFTFVVVVEVIEEDVKDSISNLCVDCELVIEYCTWMCFLAKQLAREPKRLEISLG